MREGASVAGPISYPLRLCQLGFGGVAFGVFAAEALDAAGGVHEFLFAGKERMASSADFYADVALMAGAGNKSVAAGAMHADFAVIGMNSCFHVGYGTSIQTFRFYRS